MTDFRMRLIIETILKDEQLLKQLKKDLEGLEEAGKKGQKGFDFKAMKGQLLAATAAVAAFGIATKKAFDFTFEGAQVNQLADSFDRLLMQAGVAPNLLSELKDKAHGTISEFDLMASTMTLVMGTTGELKRELIEASPQLLEIAKAANKVNPALGSTQFLFDSLARGIKRASPLILDNLGVVIKVGEAYQVFADRLGRTVDSLTAAEKTQAVLHAALEAGQPLLEQAGSTTESAADAWAHLAANIRDGINAFKSWAADTAEPAIKATDNFIFRVQNAEREIERLTKTAIESGMGYDEYRDRIVAIAEGYNVLAVSTKTASDGQSIYFERLVGYTDVVTHFTEEQLRAAQIAQTFSDTQIPLSERLDRTFAAQERMRVSAERSADAFGMTEEQIEDYAKALETAGQEFEKARQQFIKDPFAHLNQGVVGQLEAMLKAQDWANAGGQAVADFTTEVNTALFEGRITEEQARVFWEALIVEGLKVDVALGEIRQWDAARQLVAINVAKDMDEALAMLRGDTSVADLEADLKDAQTETEETLRLIEKLGETTLPSEIVDEEKDKLLGTASKKAEDVAEEIGKALGLAQEDIDALSGSFDTLKGDIDDSKRSVENLGTAIAELDGATATVTVKWVGNIPTLDTSIDDEEDGKKGDATGGSYVIPPGYPSDTYRLPLKVSSGEMVTVSPPWEKQGQGGGNNGTINLNAPVYMNSEANMTLEEMVRAAIPQYNI